MNENDLERCRRMLGVKAGVSRSDLERSFMNRNLEIIRDKNASGSEHRRELEAEHEELRAAFAAFGALTDKKKNQPAPAKNAACADAGSKPTGDASAISSGSARPATSC